MSQLSPGTYALSELNLFTETTTRTLDMPSHDPSRKLKTWADGSQVGREAGAVVSYEFIDPNSGQRIVQEMPAEEAAFRNLPGLKIYPKYEILATTVTRAGNIVNTRLLCTEAEANAIMKESKGRGLFDDGRANGPNPANYGTDPRRIWYFWTGTNSPRLVCAAEVVQDKNFLGVGHPGRLVPDANGHPDWHPDPDPPPGNWNLPKWLVPARQLQDGESIVGLGLGLGYVLRVVEAGEPQPGGGAIDAVTLQKIAQTFELAKDNNEMLKTLLDRIKPSVRIT